MSARGVVLGLRLGVTRLALGRVLWLALLTLVVTAAVAAVERRAGPLHAPSRTLSALFGVVVPLLAVGTVALTSAGDRLDAGVWAVARYGWTRGEIALGNLLLPAGLTIGLTLVATALGLAIAHGGGVGLGADLALSLPIAAVGSSAYFGWIALGATFFRRGQGRWVAFVTDLLFGASSGALALPLPRGHLRSMLGGEPVLDLSQGASSAALIGIAACATLLAIQRTGR